MTARSTWSTGQYNVYVVTGAEKKGDISEIARGLEKAGLKTEREHRIWRHDHQPFSEFELDPGGSSTAGRRV